MNQDKVMRDLTDEINVIINKFHNTIFKILKICKKLEPNNATLSSLYARTSMARDIDPLLIITRAKDKIWLHRDHIINENADFFLQSQYLEYIKDDENKSFMHSLIDLVKTGYLRLSNAERTALWGLSKDMLKHVIEYKKATGDFI